MRNTLPASRSRQPFPGLGLPSLFDQAFGLFDPSSLATSAWAPRVDIHETEDAFLIHADLPGLDPKDIDIHMEDGVLTIKGERQVEQRQQTARGVRVERQHGQFHRRFGLPDSADAEGIQATCKNGVLEVSIPKKPETKPRRIEVR